MTTCSNGVYCQDQVLVSAMQIAESIKVNIVSAKAFVNMVCGDVGCVTWCTLVRPVVNQATGDGIDAEYATLCDEYQDVFQEPGMPPRRQLDHAIDLIDESLPPPKHRQYRLSQAEHAEVKQQVEQLLERGWIRPSVLLSGALILFVRKKTG